MISTDHDAADDALVRQPAVLEVELVEDVSELPLPASEWNALAAKNETNTIFQTFEWFSAWWRAFGSQGRLFFLLVRSEGRVIGFAPLMIRTAALGLRQLEFIGSGNADYQDFVLPTDKARALHEICHFIARHSRRWDRWELGNVPEQSSTLDCLRACAATVDLRFLDGARVACPAVLLQDRSTVSKAIRRYSVRRPYNWFNRRGVLRFRHLDDPAEIESVLPHYFEQHVRRWRDSGVRSLFEEPNQRTFYRDLAANLLPKGWLSFSVVELDGAPLAFHFGFDYDGRIIWYKPSFDVRYAVRSPGLLLMGQLIEDALRRDKREFDFTIGDEAFKARFANRATFNANVSLYSSGAIYLVEAAVRKARRFLGAARRKLALSPQRT